MEVDNSASEEEFVAMELDSRKGSSSSFECQLWRLQMAHH